MIQRAASFESNKANTLRADGNDCLAAVRWSLCSFTRWMRRMAVYREQSHAGVPLRRLLRTGLLSVLSILQLLRWRVLLAAQPDYFSVYHVHIPVTDKSRTRRRAPIHRGPPLSTRQKDRARYSITCRCRK